MPTSRAWKSLEKLIAARLNGERTSKAGLGESCPDVVVDAKLVDGVRFSVECKLRGKYPGILDGALEQAKKNSEDGDIPVACFKGKYWDYDKVIVAMRLPDFQRLMVNESNS